MKAIMPRYDAMKCGRCESNYGSTIKNEGRTNDGCYASMDKKI